MSRLALTTAAVAILAGGTLLLAFASRRAEAELVAPAVSTIPPGYRDWRLISVAREEGELEDVRAILGNDLAIEAFRNGTLPFPDGSAIARLAWSLDASAENDATFGRAQSFVAGAPKNGLQFMFKDSQRFAATGGWGFAHFDEGVPAKPSLIDACHACHAAVRARDFVFTRLAH